MEFFVGRGAAIAERLPLAQITGDVASGSFLSPGHLVEDFGTVKVSKERLAKKFAFDKNCLLLGLENM
jgi:roadblock/LC7 domain-containing protein